MFVNVIHQICSVLLLVHLTVTLDSTTNEYYPMATTEEPKIDSFKQSRYEESFDNYDETDASISSREGRGMKPMDYDHGEDHDHDHAPEMHMPEEQKAVKTDPWQGYYDFLINEGSFKFWAVFQLVTAVLLIYSAFAAVYYAKFNVITTDYDYYDDFFGRSYSGSAKSSNSWFGLNSQTVQRIFDALSSKKYS